MTPDSNVWYEFGAFRLRPSDGLLLENGKQVAVPPKALALLCLLVENYGRVMSKEELMHALWPETFVEENNLTQNISLLRKLLHGGEKEENGFIVTVPRRGYRFVAPVQVITDVEEFAAERSRHEPFRQETDKPAAKETQTPVSANMPRYRSRIAVAFLALLLLAAFVYFGNFAIRRARDIAAARALETSRHALMSSNPEANDAFQRGVHVLERRARVSGKKGVEFLEQAVAKDPQFALAYAHLAVAYVMNGDDQMAVQAAARAVSLNPQLSEAHAAAGFIAMFRNWDWATAERELRLAISLDPDYARGHQWLANLLQFRGEFAQAEKEVRRALELDPQSPLMHTDLCDLLYYARRYDDAIAECRKAIDIDPDFSPPHGGLENIYFAQRNYDAAAREGIVGASKADDARLVQELEHAYKSSGITGMLRAEVKEELGESPPANYYMARDLARLGEIDRALTALFAGYRSHDFFMAFVKIDPALDPLRSDPRYTELVRRIGLGS